MNDRQDSIGNSLGDVTRVFDSEHVVDLDWLSGTLGDDFDNVPVDMERQVIPQLQAQWNLGQFNSPYQMVPNSVAPEGTAGKEKPITDDDIFSVARVVKKAMMQGFRGSEVVPRLREIFSSELLEAAVPELKKVAAEEGLLGNVYLDLSAFSDTKEAARVLGKHKTRLASFVVGKPTKEGKYVDHNGRCIDLNKTAVDQVVYSQEVLSHYENHLRNAGVIGRDDKIRTKEELRLAFLSARDKKHATPTEQPKQKAVSEEEYKSTAEAAKAVMSHNKEVLAAQVRLAQSRPVMARVQDFMLKGLVGDSLKEAIVKSMDSQTLEEYTPEIANMVKKQGLLGPLAVDVSTYPNAEAASEAVSKCFMKPKFILSTLPVDEGFLSRVQSKVKIPVLGSPSDVTPQIAEEVLASLNASSSIDDDVTAALVSKCRSGEDTPANVIKAAMFARSAGKSKTQVKEASTQVGHFHTPISSARPQVDRSAIKVAATKAFGMGHSASAVQDKVAGYVPIGEAIGIMREALAAMDSVSASALDDCNTEKYPLKKSASIVKAAKCDSCVRNICGTCSAQGRSFKVLNVKKASSTEVQKDPAEILGLSNSNLLNIDMSQVITAPKRDIDVSFGKGFSIDF